MTSTSPWAALAVGSLCLALLDAPLRAQADEKPGTAPAPVNVEKNPWFEQTEVDLGTFLEGETATGFFEFENPRDATHQLKHFQPSCACSKAIVHVGERRYEVSNDPKPNSIHRVDDGERELVQHIAVGPDESGKVEVQVNLRGVQGPKEAMVTFQTSDEAVRFINLKTTATATQFFAVMPPEVNLNKMSWKDQREFTAQVTSPIRPDFEITGHDPLPPQMEVEYRKEMRGDKAVWVIDGKYGPNVDPHAGGGIINLHTDVDDKKVQVRVMAWVEGPLTFKPGGFVALGMIRAGKGVTKTVEIEPTDDFDLKVEKLEVRNLSVPEEFVSVSSEKQDGKVLVHLVVSPEVPRRLVRGDLFVHLNHPAAKKKEFQFNGFVR